MSEQVLAAEKLREAFARKPAPAVAASSGLTRPKRYPSKNYVVRSVARLLGNLVWVLHLKKLPSRALRQEIWGAWANRDRVHTEQAGDSVAWRSLKRSRFRFQSQMDTGETAKSMASTLGQPIS